MPKSISKKLEEKYSIDEKTGCWVWNGAVANKANKWIYGLITVDGKLRPAHRVMYELHKGEIPNGFVLDHLCRNTRCINPAHLEPVTQKININRGERYESNKTLCDNGHKLSGSNLYVDPNGHRECRICRASQWKQYRDRHGLDYVSKEEKRNNHVNTTFVEFNGIRKPLKTFAEELGISYSTVKSRFARGWPIERVLKK